MWIIIDLLRFGSCKFSLGKLSYGDLCTRKVDRHKRNWGIEKYGYHPFEGVTSICRLIHDRASVE